MWVAPTTSAILLMRHGAGLGPAKNAAAVSGHGIVFKMSEYAPVGFAIWIEVESGECKAAPSVPMIENINACLGVTGADIGGIHNEHVLVFFGVAAVAQRVPILFDPRALDFVGGDRRQGHQVMAGLPIIRKLSGSLLAVT